MSIAITRGRSGDSLRIKHGAGDYRSKYMKNSKIDVSVEISWWKQEFYDKVRGHLRVVHLLKIIAYKLEVILNRLCFKVCNDMLLTSKEKVPFK